MPESKYTPELLEKFRDLVDKWDPLKARGKYRDGNILDLFSDLGYQRSKCFHLGITRPRIKDYRDKHPEFKDVFEEWQRKRDHYFLKLARIYHTKDKQTVQWIYLSKNDIGWSDNPTNTESDDNSIPDLIRTIKESAEKISKTKVSRSKKK